MALRPIEGTFEECFKHFGKHADAQLFRAFCLKMKVDNSQTLYRWSHGNVPVGEYRVQASQHLMDMGYRMPLIEKRPEAVRAAIMAFAYGLATIDELAIGFGTDSPSKRDVFLPVLMGKAGMSEERLKKGEAFLVPLRSLIDEVRAKLPNAKPPPQRVPAPVQDTSAVPSATPVAPHLTENHSAVIQMTAAMLTSVFPLLQLVNSDQFTPEERKMLREKLGFFGAMSISTELNRLCSERAREQFKSEGNAK